MISVVGPSQSKPKRNLARDILLVCSLLFALCFGLLPMTLGSASAVDYPTRPVHWIVGYPAGGTTDILARLIGQWLSEHLGQQFIIENRPGAGNNLATENVVNAAPDGTRCCLSIPPMGSMQRSTRSSISILCVTLHRSLGSCVCPT